MRLGSLESSDTNYYSLKIKKKSFRPPPIHSKWFLCSMDLPTTGSKTACVACSSPIGVLNQIRFNLFAMGESSVDATGKWKKIKIKIN